jgi:hypothetical protein
MFGQFRFATELDAAGFGARASFARARPDQIPLEFGQATEHGQYQAAVRGGGVGPCVAERAETGFAVGDRREVSSPFFIDSKNSSVLR